MKSVHRYPFPGSMNFWVFNFVAIFFLIGSVYSSVNSVIRGETDHLIVSFLFLFFGFFVLFSGNLFPEVISDDEGLFVRFSFWRLRIKWEEVIEVKPSPMNFLVKPLSKVFSVFTTHIVKTRALTSFHRFYGLYVFSFRPSFLIHSHISNFNELLSTIENKTQSKRVSS